MDWRVRRKAAAEGCSAQRGAEEGRRGTWGLAGDDGEERDGGIGDCS